MSTPIAEAYVTIRPQLAGNFKGDLKQQLNADVKAVNQQITKTNPLGGSVAPAAAQAAAEIDDFRVKAGRARVAGLGLRTSTVGAGIALVAIAQASREASAQLAVTGSAAGTTEGRIRNLGSNLLTGNIVGGLKALTVGATASAEALSKLQAEAASGNIKNIEKLLAGANALGATKLADQVRAAQFGARSNLQQDRASAASITPGLKDDLAVSNASIREAQSGLRQSQRGTDAYTKAYAAFAQATTERTKILGEIEAKSGPVARDAARDANFNLNLARAQQTKGTGNDQAILKGRQDYLRKQIKVLEDEGATTTEAKSRLQTLYGKLNDTSGQITTLAKQSLADRQARLQEQTQLQQTELQIQEANARTDGQRVAALQAESALASKLSTDKRLDAQTRADSALQAAQLDAQVFEINRAAAEAAKQAADERRRQAEQDRKDALEKLKAKREEARQLKELRMDNALAAAGLTKSTADDKKIIQKRIAYFKDLVANTRGLEREQNRAKLIAERANLKNLAGAGAGAGGGATTADFFKQAAQQFSEFGSNIGGRNGVLSGQDARGRFAGMALGAQQSPMNIVAAGIRKLGDLAQPQLSESVKHTQLLANISIGIHRLRLPAIAVDREAIRRARQKATNLGGQ